ncbi:MAG TPA: TolC family protein [Terracidiphilus sp.]
MATAAHAQTPVSLRTVVDLAQRSSTTVRSAQADVEKARAALSQSKDVIIPSLSVSTGLPVFPSEGFTGSPPTLWSATVQSLVFSWPQKYYIASARDGLKAADNNLKDAREQVALDASTAYIELDAVNQELASARAQDADATRMVEIEQQRAEAGVDPLNDLLQAKLTAAQLKLKRLHLETRAAVLAKQLSALTGLPDGSIAPDHATIPEVPQIRAGDSPRTLPGIEAGRLVADARLKAAKGDNAVSYYPQLAFFAQYNRNTTLLNNINSYFAKPLPANNVSSGISVQIPIFDLGHRAKARESAADALRARVEAEQAERQNEVQIAQLTGSLRELDTLAEIAQLKQQIAAEQLKTVQTQLEDGNGSGGATPQLSPKAEQLARIDQNQKAQDAMDAGFELAKARLSLMRALGHMEDWLHLVNAR